MAAVLLLGGVAFLVYSQKKAQEYEEAFRKGMTSWKERQAERALAEWRKASKADARDPELWLLIGRCELMLGNSDKAVEAWAEALKRDPEYKPAMFERGKEALGRHIERRLPPVVDGRTGWMPLGLESAARVEGGAEEVQRILADLKASSYHTPEFGKFGRGALNLLEGRYRDAHPLLQAYSDANGWDTGAIALVGIAAHYGALPDRAEKALSEALAARSEKSWLRVRAAARYLQANYEGARADYREAGSEKDAEPLFVRRIPSQGLILWLKGDDGVDLTGTSVSRWKDQSEGHHDASPKEPDGGPHVTASAIRGHAAIQFSGKEDELRLPDGFEDFSAGLSMFVVGQPQVAPGDPWSFLFLATAATGAGRIEAFIGRPRDTEQIAYSAEDLQSRPKAFVPGKPPAKGWSSWGAVHEPSEAARFYQRGELLATGSLVIPRKTLRTRNRVGAGLQGQVAEVLLYKRSLSELERLGVEAYLTDRYFPSAGAAAPPAAEKR